MEYSIAIYFLLFIIYSIAGWIMEVIGKLIEKKKFINRGFLIGPYCPIYGCGALIVTCFLKKYMNDWFVLFSVSIIICGLLEYVTSYIMEKLFRARWWDYSERKYNINGRVCLETLIPFGVLSLLIIYVTNPFILKYLLMIQNQILNILAGILFFIFILDSIISLKIISNVRSTSTRINNERENKNNRTCDNTEEITEKVKEILRGKSILNRRLIDAYPNLQAKIEKKKEEIKEKTEEIKEDIKNKIEEKKSYLTKKKSE